MRDEAEHKAEGEGLEVGARRCRDAAGVSDCFEVMPFGRAVAEAAELPDPVRLTVTCSPRHGPDESVAVAQQLRALGHDVTAHLAARMIRDPAHLDTLLGEMAQAGVDDALVIGGDETPPLGAYSSAVELLPIVHEHPQRPRRLGIAGYPEGHPLISDTELAAAFAKKSQIADYVTTQLCFDPAAIVRFIEPVELPVVVGLPGIVDTRKLLEISMRVGVGPSLSYLRKQRGVRNLLRLSGLADRLFDALAPRVDSFHFFTFNQLLDTWRWAHDKRLAITPEQKEVTT
jgi:methylenetetrahydrofolate reductase (NADPH)